MATGEVKPNRFALQVDKRTGPTPPPGSAGERMSKYTVLLSARVAMELDEDVLRLRREAARKVDKSEVIRTLVDLLHTDDTLFDQVKKRIATA
jgi:hypothetical protein